MIVSVCDAATSGASCDNRVVADYPAEFEFDVVLRDGGIAQVRPIRPADQHALAEFFDRTGPESRYFRFFRSKPTLSARELEYYTKLDYERRMAFIAEHDGQMIGVARYDISEDVPTRAEVAFMVEDAHQGRGVGTQLFQILTIYARRQGVASFEAYVLPENAKMMRLFRNSGYQMRRAFEEGVYIVSLDTAESEDSLVAEEGRERRAVAASLLPIFYPASIAVVGASREEGSIGSTLFRNLLVSGFNGPLYPVHDEADVVNSVRAYRSVLEIPGPVDLAFIVVPAAVVPAVVRDCDQKGVRGLVVISAGFSEIGTAGADVEDALLDAVRSAGMRMVGPNCMGLLNTDPVVRMNGTFAPVYPPRGNVAMLSQSGALGIAILDYARRNAIGISSFVSVGNKADVSSNDLILYWEEDPSTDVIVLYLESFGNPRRFARLARRVARTKPIVAVKSGRTAAGTRAASSHTGALASTDRAVEALFRESGVIRTDTLEELFAVTQLVANQPIPAGRRVGIVTNAGGPAILAADALAGRGMELPEFSKPLRKHLAERLPAEAAVANPVDMIAGAGAGEFRHAVSALLDSDEVDAVIAIYVPTSLEGATEVAEAIKSTAAAGAGKTLLSVFMSEGAAAELLHDERVAVPSFAFPESAALALSRSAHYGEWLRRPLGNVRTFGDIDPGAARTVVEAALGQLGAKGGWLEPDAVESVLAAFGIPLPDSEVAGSAGEAVAVAERLGGPVAMKVVAGSILHKTDVGGVVLGVEEEQDIRRVFDELMQLAPDTEGVLVQEMIGNGQEVLVGMTEDPSFGPLIVFGLGGVYVELLGDVAFRLHPVTDLDAESMIREIRTAPLLDGYRGSPAGDLAALADLIQRVSTMVTVIPEMVELDLNPVKVFAEGEGVRALDARVRVRPSADRWIPELADIPSVMTER